MSLYNCLFICPIITQAPLDRFASNIDWGNRETHMNDFRMRLQRRLYGIILVRFLASMVPGMLKLDYFCA